MKLQRLDQLLSSLGYASRREARDFLLDNEVLIHGTTAFRHDQRVLASEVTVNGEPLLAPSGLLALYHKPVGLTCSRSEKEGTTIYEALPEQWSLRSPAVSSVGRLDRYTSGLLLMTDVGSLIQRFTSPRSEIKKVYQVTVDHPLEERLVPLFAAGTLLLDGEQEPCLPAGLTLKSSTEAELVLTEGRYHQVRRMFASQGWEVTRLHRSHFGDYDLSGLAEGEWRIIELPE